MPYRKQLFFDDFRAWPTGAVAYDYTPLREYHFFALDHGPGWREGTLNNRWRGKERWQIVLEGDQPALEQVALNQGVPPLMTVGDDRWRAYAVRCELRPLNRTGRVGVVFWYRHCLDYFALVGTATHLQFIRVTGEGEPAVLAETAFARDYDQRCRLEVVADAGILKGSAGTGSARAEVELPIAEEGSGKVGVLAEMPVRFYSAEVTTIDVTTPEPDYGTWSRQLERDARKLTEARERYPRPQLVRVIDTPGFGAGKALRFGDLDGDGRLEIVIAQNQPRVQGDSYDMISCLTALDLDGRVLWQAGRPSARHGLLTNDLPLQLYDIDGDGADEVICALDFRMLILDGRTGKVNCEAPTPASITHERAFGWGSEDAYHRIVGDSIHICNVRGNDTPRDILIKDRYNDVWVYDHRFNLLWSASCRTGHFPYSYDFDGDGRDELLIGYRMYSADGEVLWDLDLGDHADGLGILPQPDGTVRIVVAAGDEGFLFADAAGRILHHERRGHVQTVNIGNFRPERQGLEFVTITYWRYPGITSLYSQDGELLAQAEPYPVGSHIKPVNWTGEGDELILFSASARYPGLLDGHLRSVVNLPDDGHPDLCCEALDLLGDPRDEIVAWDQERLFIYTQDRPFAGSRVYTPKRPAHHNYSNYRCEISLPGWRDWPTASPKSGG